MELPERPEPLEPMEDVSEGLTEQHGLSSREWEALLVALNRNPSHCELGIVSAMWSEHCSYKSTRHLLRRFPTTGSRVLQGPGENAGAVDIGGGLAIVFKIESHNHPSFIAPFQGAATGVGGILRDIFTMGAKPVACLNALSFGSLSCRKTRRIVSEVVSGIAHYGNSFGVPTVGGEVRFESCYAGNPLVNVMAVGVVRHEDIFRSRPSRAGLEVMVLGAATGRDGVHGASMASGSFGSDGDDGSSDDGDLSEVSKLPTVQVGDPFTGQRLCRACLEMMRAGALDAIQDMGAAGLTCAAVEMAANGGLGMKLNLDQLPVRAEGMTAYEMMLSESQERMLLIPKPGQEGLIRTIALTHNLNLAPIGSTCEGDRLIVVRNGRYEADLAVGLLCDGVPEPEYLSGVRVKSAKKSSKKSVLTERRAAKERGILEPLKILLRSSAHASKRWIFEQYDCLIQGETRQPPGADAAVVAIPGTTTGVAMTVDVNPRYCEADPGSGASQAVAEAWRNICAAGGAPIAITDNLNFASPENPDVMGSIEATVDGIAAACRELKIPVVSGNVSLYNQTGNTAIWPTPTIGMIGTVDLTIPTISPGLSHSMSHLLVVGPSGGHLSCSDFQAIIDGVVDGSPPPVDLGMERRIGIWIQEVIRDGLAGAVHDVGGGGLAIAVAEMALAGTCGVNVTVPAADHDEWIGWAFGEHQARYLIAATGKNLRVLCDRAAAADVPLQAIGEVGGTELSFSVGGVRESAGLEALKNVHENFLPKRMEPS